MSCLVLSNREEVNAAIVLISITSHLLHYTRLWYSEGLIKRCAMVDVHLRVGHRVPTLVIFGFFCKDAFNIYKFILWCPQKYHTYLNKPVAETYRFV